MNEKVNKSISLLLEDVAEHEDIMKQFRMFLNKYEREFESLQEEIISYKKSLQDDGNLSDDEINKKIYKKYKSRIYELMGKIGGLVKEYDKKIYKPYLNMLFVRSALLLSASVAGIIGGPILLVTASMCALLADLVITLMYKLSVKVTGRYYNIANNIFETIVDSLFVPLGKSSLKKLYNSVETLLSDLEKRADEEKININKYMKKSDKIDIDKIQDTGATGRMYNVYRLDSTKFLKNMIRGLQNDALTEAYILKYNTKISAILNK